MIYQPSRKKPYGQSHRSKKKAAMRAALVADPDRLPSKYDPLANRLKGIAPHGDTPFDVPVISEIAPNLWQGGTRNGLILPPFIDHLVTLYTTEAYVLNREVKSALTYKLRDHEDQEMDQIDTIARWINECRKSGVVLVHCSAGLNRSSLVVARALMLEGMSGKAAIDQIRMKRSAACLCNKSFEKWLLGFE